MHVIYISRIYPNRLTDNGRVFHSQAKELMKLGCKVTVISPIPFSPKILSKRKKTWSEYSKLPLKEIYDEIEVYHPRYIKLPKAGRFLSTLNEHSLMRSIRMTLNQIAHNLKFDIIHCHMTYPDALGIRNLKKRYNVPVIVSARSSDLDLSIGKTYIKNKMRSIYTNADGIVTPSVQLQKKLLNELGFESSLITNGIYPDELSQVKSSDSIEMVDEKIILSIGNLTQTKGIQYNVEALAELVKEYEKVKYIIIGEGEFKEDLITLTKKLKLEKYIQFKGSLSHGEAMRYLKDCDIFSLPSYRETFGLVYLEALFYGKPVIICQNQGIDGVVVNDQSCKVVRPNSVEDVYLSLKELIANDKKRNELGSRGREIVQKGYFWNDIGREIKEFYSSRIN
ncbi:glycosyltransferase [Paenibacillus daejeonensis]|uniref:glycosyltransferase n=1 Tax=Paenibacillus daejeonensis TaxID=135193 RepID=UPI000366858A|nr:glycosyltransferase [Paenibacillus daejeonensis]